MNSYWGGVNKTFYENSCSKLQPNNGVPVQNKWAAAIQITLCVSFKVQRLQYSLTNICDASRVNNQPLGKHSTNGSLPPNHNKIYDPRVDVQPEEGLCVDWSMNIEFHVSIWNTQLYVGKAYLEWVKRIVSHAHFCGYCEESKDQTVNYSNWAFNQWNSPTNTVQCVLDIVYISWRDGVFHTKIWKTKDLIYMPVYETEKIIL